MFSNLRYCVSEGSKASKVGGGGHQSLRQFIRPHVGKSDINLSPLSIHPSIQSLRHSVQGIFRKKRGWIYVKIGHLMYGPNVVGGGGELHHLYCMLS